MNKGNIFISQCMRGRSQTDIQEERNRAVKFLESRGWRVVDSYWPGYAQKNIKHRQVYYLALSLKALSGCDAIYFCKGWNDGAGCRLEHQAAVTYNIPCIYEE